MKRFLAVAAVGLAAVGLYAAVAPAGRQAVTPRQFAALSKKVATLQKTLVKVRKDLSVVEGCAFVHAYPFNQYGNPPTEGYVYDNGDGTTEKQTALDIAPEAGARTWMLTTDADCASAINGSKHKAATSLRPHVK